MPHHALSPVWRRVVAGFLPDDFFRRMTPLTRDLLQVRAQGVDMNAGKMKVVANSAAAATVISVLVAVVGAGTKWMGN